jgi:hypothetical protein
MTDTDNRAAFADAMLTALNGTAKLPDRFQQAAFDAKEEFRRQVEQINQDHRFSAVGKAEAIEALRAQVETRCAELQAEHRRDADQRRERLTSKLLDRTASESDPATTIAWRDAAQRVAALEDAGDERSAAALLRQAIRNRDISLEKSLLRAAIDNGWSRVVDDYVAARPSHGPDVQELCSLTTPTDDLLSRLNDYAAFRVDDPHANVSVRAPIQYGDLGEAFASWANENGVGRSGGDDDAGT